jgi:hypothetical protein
VCSAKHSLAPSFPLPAQVERTSVPYSRVTKLSDSKGGNETFYKSTVEVLMKDNKKMKTKLEALEQESRTPF